MNRTLVSSPALAFLCLVMLSGTPSARDGQNVAGLSEILTLCGDETKSIEPVKGKDKAFISMSNGADLPYVKTVAEKEEGTVGDRKYAAQRGTSTDTDAPLTALLGDFSRLRDDDRALKAPWQLGQIPRQVRLELRVRLEEILGQDPDTTWASIKSRFFEDIDPYIVWHDGIESVVDFSLLDRLHPKERIVAELVFYNALEKEFDDRWLTGLVRLRSMDGLGLLKNVFAREKYPANLIKTAGAILAFEPESEHLEFLAGLIRSSHEEDLRIDAMTELKILIERGVYKKSHPRLLDDSLFQALKAHEYLVRYHAYDSLKMLHGIGIDPQADPVFELLLENRTEKDFKKAEKMLREKMRD
jgi:hypothetical protein